MTHADRATAYARAVTKKQVLACKWVKLACKRHLDNLRDSKKKAYPYRYDPEPANRVCRFIEKLPHVKGKWGDQRLTIVLEDFQCFILCSLHGWRRKADGLRRFRTSYTEMARKNAKSTLAAGNGLYMLSADNEYGGEVYSGATSEKQAWEVFRPAKQMAERTPALTEALGIQVNAKNLNQVSTGSRFEPIIGNPGDGASPSNAIIDEYHEHDSDDQYDTMKTGMGARQHPLMFVITTAGSDTAGPCYALRTQVTDMLEGKVPDETLFGIIYTIDEGDDRKKGDDWTDPKILEKANPNIGVSVNREYLEGQQQEAVNHPRKQATFKTKHLDVWVTASAPYFNLELWNRQADASIDTSQFADCRCVAALDLSSKLDLTAYVRVFEIEEDEEYESEYYVFGKFYIPEERINDPERRHYKQWVEQGHLIATDGNIIDYERIQNDVEADDEAYPITELRYDPWGATQLAQRLQTNGMTVIEIPQNVRHLSEPMKWVDALVQAGRLFHDGNPVLAWAIGNEVAKVDANDNVYPRKEQGEKKIDPAVALIIAIGGLVGQEEERSVYEDRGIVSV